MAKESLVNEKSNESILRHTDEKATGSAHPTCYICGSTHCTQCTKCLAVHVCQHHQASHRRDEYCFPFTIDKNDKQGRFLVATRDIQPMELILVEKAVATGPYTKSLPQCLGCAKREKLKYPCPGCGFPLCGKECAVGKHEIECQFFRKVGFKVKVEKFNQENDWYAAISVLRLIHLRSAHPVVYTELLKLEDHCEERRQQDPKLDEFHRVHVVQFITKVLRVDIAEEEVRRLIGIMFTNSANLELPMGFGRESGFYPTYAFINHSCRANTKTLKFPDQRLEVRAQMPIKKGDEISTQYLQSMKATFARRPVLKSKWFFECGCRRCLDPTEGGSFLAAMLCQNGRCRGAVVPQDPIDGESDWQCLDCGHILQDLQRVIDTVQFVAYRLENPGRCDDIVAHYERLIHQFSEVLHPRHYLNIQMKERLAILYGNIPQYSLLKMFRPHLERKIQVTLEVLDVMDILDPGYTSNRGKFLNELNKARKITITSDVKRGLLPRKYEDKLAQETKDLKKYLDFYRSQLFQETGGKQQN